MVTGNGMRETELMEALKLILDRLNSGKIPITEEMVRRAQANGVLPRGGMHSTHISSQTGVVFTIRSTINLISID